MSCPIPAYELFAIKFLLSGFIRVLKFFAVCYGLRLTLGATYTLKPSFVRRKSLQTSITRRAKKFLMHAHKTFAQNLNFNQPYSLNRIFISF